MSAITSVSGLNVGDHVQHASDLVTLPASPIASFRPCSNGVVFAETTHWSAPADRVRLADPNFAGMCRGSGTALPIQGSAA